MDISVIGRSSLLSGRAPDVGYPSPYLLPIEYADGGNLMTTLINIAAITLASALLAACSSGDHWNIESVSAGTAYQAQYRKDLQKASYTPGERILTDRSVAINAKPCLVQPGEGELRLPVELELLSRGDMVKVLVGIDETFSGVFEVSRDGRLKLPHISSIDAHGRSASDLEKDIAQRLVTEQFYRTEPRVSVRVSDFALARVYVSGAVFEPGAADIGATSGNDRDKARQDAIGASTEERSLARALRAAGGVRPDADLANITVIRAGKRIPIDARPALKGRRFADIMLLADDEVVVPSRGCFQDALMQPSSVTAPGVKVFMSNLTKPADANALSAVGKDARELRYGTRFMQAVVGMNCVGGTRMTNANRHAVLFSRNPVTGQSIVIERSIENLMERADRDDLDPYILPGDALACYDSTVTNIVDVARSLTSILGVPLAALAL
jgi:polysaccharide export outer membrane protein